MKKNEEKKADVALLKNVDAEKKVLGAIIVDYHVFDASWQSLKKEMLTDEASRKCYDAISEIVAEGKQPEPIGVGMRLAEYGVPIADYLLDNENATVTLTNQRIQLLADLTEKRNLYALCVKGQQLATSPASTLAEFQDLLADFRAVVPDEDTTQSIGKTLRQLCDDVADRMTGGGEKGILTGLHIFDTRHGFHGGDLVIITAETSQGKSTLASTMAYNMAANGIPVVYYSLEMGANQLAARMVARPTGVSSSRLLYDEHLTESEYNGLWDSACALENMPLYFDENNKTTFAKITGSIRTMVRKKGVKVAFVDYLQILANGKVENREAIIADMARDMKNLSVELGICIVALSQMARDGNNHAPSIERLRGSGQVAEAADVVVGIYRPEVYGISEYKNGTLTKDTAKLSILKWRNGSLGSRLVRFNGELTFFEDAAKLPTNEIGDPWT